MNIATGACMTKNRLWCVPITQTVINAVESLAESQGYKSLKLLGKNKTRLLPSDWDEDEEYIFDDSYDSDDDDDNDEEEDNVDRFEEINEDEIEALHENNNNENNENNEHENEENLEQAGVPQHNIEQAGVPQQQLPNGPEQHETTEGPNVIEDKPTNELANENTDGTETNKNEEETNQ